MVPRVYRAGPGDVKRLFRLSDRAPGPPFPEALHLKKMCGVVWNYVGPLERAQEVFELIKAFGPPDLYGVQEMPFPALQSAFDALYPPGHQWYWRADFVRELSDEAIDKHLEHAARLPTMQSTMHLYPVDGAAHRVGKNETAWSYRDANWGEVIVGVDPDPAQAQTLKAWTVAYWEALHSYSAGRAYVTMMMDEGQERVRAAYRDNYARLARVKAIYDPDNLFHINQNIRPTG